MGRMLSSKIRWSRSGVYQHWCPACKCRHEFPVEQPNAQGYRWRWNADLNKPSFEPSMRIKGREPIADGNELDLQIEQLHAGIISELPYRSITLCHYFLTDGKISYCQDCPHELRGQTVDLPDWPEPYLSEFKNG